MEHPIIELTEGGSGLNAARSSKQKEPDRVNSALHTLSAGNLKPSGYAYARQ